MELQVIFFVFLLSFAFFSPLGHTRPDIIVARGQQSQYRHRIASKARSTHYLLYVAYTPRVACTVRLVLMCTCILRASIPTSNLFCCCLFSSHLRDLHCLVSYIELLFTTGLAAEYVVPYSVYRNNISPARQALCVTSHMYYS